MASAWRSTRIAFGRVYDVRAGPTRTPIRFFLVCKNFAREFDDARRLPHRARVAGGSVAVACMSVRFA